MDHTLLLCAAILFICVAVSRISQRLGVPSLLLFLGLGMLFGSDGLHIIPFDNFTAAEQICSAALFWAFLLWAVF